MLSKILLTVMLSASIVQVQAMDSLTSSQEETAVHHPSRKEMTKEIFDGFFKDHYDVKLGEDFPALPSQVRTEIKSIEDVVASKFKDAIFPSFEKVMEQLSSDALEAYYHYYTDPAIRAFAKELNKPNGGSIDSLHVGLTGLHTSASVPPTFTFNQLVGSLEKIKTFYQDFEKDILIQAHKEVVRTLENVEFNQIPTTLSNAFPHLTQKQLTDITTATAKHTGDPCPNCGDYHDSKVFIPEFLPSFLADNFGHMLWNGHMNKDAWEKLVVTNLNNMMMDSLAKKDPFIALFSDLFKDNEKSQPAIPSLNEEQKNNIFLSTVVGLHQKLEQDHPEGFPKYEDFFKSHGTQIEGLAKIVSFLAKNSLDEVTKDIPALIDSVLSSKKSPTANTSSQKPCPDCGQIHGSSPFSFPMGGLFGMDDDFLFGARNSSSKPGPFSWSDSDSDDSGSDDSSDTSSAKESSDSDSDEPLNIGSLFDETPEEADNNASLNSSPEHEASSSDSDWDNTDSSVSDTDSEDMYVYS